MYTYIHICMYIDVYMYVLHLFLYSSLFCMLSVLPALADGCFGGGREWNMKSVPT